MFSGKPLVFTNLASELQRLPLLEAEGPEAACSLRRELRRDVNGVYARFLTHRLDEVAAELRSKAPAWTELGATESARTLWMAARHATPVISAAWTAIHGRTLSNKANHSLAAPGAVGDPVSALSDRVEENKDAQVDFVLILGQIGILAIWEQNLVAGEAIRRALNDILTPGPEFLVPYALGLIRCDQLDLALDVLQQLIDAEHPKALVIQGFIYLVKGDGRWRSVLTTVTQPGGNPEARECAQYWIDFVDASTKDVGRIH